MTRDELHQTSGERLQDAAALLTAGRWSGAYYLAGYAVECALKACVAKQTREHDFPDKERAFKSHTHKIEALVEVARLKTERKADTDANPAREQNWATVVEWSEQARYQTWTEADARKLFEAISDPVNGVLPWIMDRW